jgi:hypothetical protein
VIHIVYIVFFNVEMRKHEADSASSEHERSGRFIQGFRRQPEGKDHLKDVNVGGSILLKWISEKLGRNVWTEVVWLRTGTGGVLL